MTMETRTPRQLNLALEELRLEGGDQAGIVFHRLECPDGISGRPNHPKIGQDLDTRNWTRRSSTWFRPAREYPRVIDKTESGRYPFIGEEAKDPQITYGIEYILPGEIISLVIATPGLEESKGDCYREGNKLGRMYWVRYPGDPVIERTIEKYLSHWYLQKDGLFVLLPVGEGVDRVVEDLDKTNRI